MDDETTNEPQMVDDQAAYDPYQTEPVQSASPEGRYRFLRPLGEGNLGVLSVSLDAELNREIALKRIRENLASNPAYLDRFCREAEITGALEHPGVVPIYGFGKDDRGQLFYAMRLIRGEELTAKIKQFHAAVASGKQQLNSVELRNLLRRLVEICNTMAYAHARGVVHRDLKPANIMLGPYGETLVVDWGLAKPSGTAGELSGDDSKTRSLELEGPVAVTRSNVSQTHDGSIVGTPIYAPPEQMLGKLDAIDHRSDIYCIGIILYELLTGSPPLRNCTLAELTSSKINGLIPSPREVSKLIPKPIEAVCLKAIQAKPSDRYQDVLDLRADLERFLDDQPVSVYRESTSERLHRWMRNHGPLVKAVTISLILISLVSLLAAYNISLARNRQAKAKQEATQLLKIARETTDHLLTNARERLEEIPDAADVQELLLKDAAEAYAKIAEVSTNDPVLRSEIAAALSGLGGIQKSMDKPQEAIASLIRAIEILSPLANSQSASPDSKLDLAHAQVELSRIYSDQRIPQKAVESVLSALEVCTALPKSDPRTLLVTAECLVQHAVTKYDEKDYLAAVDLDHAAVQTLEEALQFVYKGTASETNPLLFDIRFTLARAARNEAVIGADFGLRSSEQVTNFYSLAINQLRWVNEKFPDRKLVAKEYADTQNSFADHLISIGKADAAAELYKTSATELRELANKFPQQLEYRNSLILALLGQAATDGERQSESADDAYGNAQLLLSNNSVKKRYRLTAAQAAIYLAQVVIEWDSNWQQAKQLLSETRALVDKLQDVDVLPGVLDSCELVECKLLMHALDTATPTGLSSRLQTFTAATEYFQAGDNIYNSAAKISAACQVLSANGDVPPQDLSKYLDIALQRLATALRAPNANLSGYFRYAQDDPDFEFLILKKPEEFKLLAPAILKTD